MGLYTLDSTLIQKQAQPEMEQKAPSEEIDISLEDLKEDRKSTNADQIKVSNGNELLILDADDKNMAGDKDMVSLKAQECSDFTK